MSRLCSEREFCPALLLLSPDVGEIFQDANMITFGSLDNSSVIL